MAVARFVMLACSGEHLSVRRSLMDFKALKLKSLSASLLPTSLLMANSLMDRGWNPTPQTGVASGPNENGKRSQERVKV